jgi:hypothetical protein
MGKNMRKLSMTPRAIKDRERNERVRFAGICLDCRAQTLFAEYYMVHEALWHQANPAADGMLCVGCLEERIGRMLTSADFIDAPINNPHDRKSDRLISRLLAK